MGATLFPADAENGGKERMCCRHRAALNPDLTAHHFHQTFADGKSQAGPSVLPGSRRVGLAEGLKQPGPLFLGQTNAAVPHRELRVRRPFSQVDHFGGNHDFAVFRELDGVVGQS